MADGAINLNYQSNLSAEKPPLDMGVRLRLSVMMFLQFAVWGSWFTVWNLYLGKSVVAGGLGFKGSQIGSLYGTMALGAILSMMVAGQLADRVMSSEFLMAIFHIAGAFLLYAMARVHDYNTLWWVSLAYALVYNPTLSIANSISFANIPDATRDFPSLRVLGTAGWIAVGLAVGFLLPASAQSSNLPLILAAVLSAVLGLFSFALPHTPPSGKGGDLFCRFFARLDCWPTRALGFSISRLASSSRSRLAFYYTFAGQFLDVVGVKHVSAFMTIGQFSELGFMVLLPFALKRFGMKGVLAVGMAAWAARYGLFAVEKPFILVLLGVAMHGVCFDFFLAAGFIHTDNKAPAAIRGSAQALFSFLTYGIGMLIGNQISGIVVDRFTTGSGALAVTDWSKVWMVPAIGAVVCLAACSLVLWHDKPEIAG